MENYLTYLNEFGDITIAWEDDSNDEMVNVIQRQMDKGMTFWSIEPRFAGLLPPRKTKLNSIDDIKDDRILSMNDEDFFKLVADGAAAAITPSKSYNPLTFLKRLKSPKEVVENETKTAAVMKPLRGG